MTRANWVTTAALAGLLGLAGTAYSYSISPSKVPAGNTRLYHIESGEFPSWMIDEITEAADEWDGGGSTSDRIRGANWHWIRGADVGNGVKWNTRSEMWDKTRAWHDNNGSGEEAIAVAYRNGAECDVIWVDENSDPDLDLVATAASNQSATGTMKAVQEIAIHELGHCLGFNHDDSGANTMNSGAPGGAADFGLGQFRVGEDESQGLRAWKSHSSTGTNLALSRWVDAGAGGSEAWDNQIGGTWAGFPGSSISGVQAITLHSMSTSTLSGTQARWSLSVDGICFDGDDVILDTKTFNSISSNESSLLQPPSPFIPAGTTPGLYFLCAQIDSTSLHSETTEADNVVRSDGAFFNVLQ